MKRKMRFISQKSRLFRLQLPYFFSNRNAKDRLFCYVFEHDRNTLLQLYNALNLYEHQGTYRIMDDILLPFRAEVKKMLLTEYNKRKYMRMFRKEAREEGLAEGKAEGREESIALFECHASKWSIRKRDFKADRPIRY